MVALAGVFAPQFVFAQDPGLSIDTGSPDALCPELASTRDAVRRRLGELIVPSGSGWRARYTIGHAPAGTPRDFVRLELFGPEGALQLSRDLPLEGESCSTMAEVIALVLDRYFRALLSREPAAASDQAASDSASRDSASRDIGDAAQRPATPTASEPAPAPNPSGARVGATPAAPAAPIAPASATPPLAERSTPAEPQAPNRAGLQYMGIEVALRKVDRPSLGARALLELWPRTYAGVALLVGLLEDSQELPDGGDVRSREATVRGFLAWGPDLGPVRFYVGPGLSLDVARGAGSGLPESSAGYRATGGAGMDVGLLWGTQASWSVSVNAALDVSIAELGGRFVVEDTEVLPPDLVRGWFGIGIGYVFGL